MARKKKTEVFDDVADADALDTTPQKVGDVKVNQSAAPPAVPEILIEDEEPVDRQADWPTIYIDEEAGQSNYVPVGHNGTVYRIMRGIEVKVPPHVVDVLKDAIAARLVQVVDPATGQKENIMRPYNAIPFRVINYPS